MWICLGSRSAPIVTPDNEPFRPSYQELVQFPAGVTLRRLFTLPGTMAVGEGVQNCVLVVWRCSGEPGPMRTYSVSAPVAVDFVTQSSAGRVILGSLGWINQMANIGCTDPEAAE